jgi:methylmalonyl-CoA mutase cobalamin-binding subunit
VSERARPLIIGAAVGNCVHIAGLLNFLRLAEAAGYEVHSMGPAVPVAKLVGAAVEANADIIAVSYRLTPEVAANLIDELRCEAERAGIAGRRFIFGGTPPVASVARATGFFDAVFSGEESVPEIMAYLRGEARQGEEPTYAGDLVSRITASRPHPLIRHHFGLPSLSDTIEGARRIAESRTVDVISVGPDQNAQESFFRPSEMLGEQDGAGGVPVRTEEDLAAIYKASRTGNYPLVRCYSGTRDLMKWAEMSVRVIRNAWAAIPLCWYSQLDGRSGRTPQEAMEENMSVVQWYASRGIPVEVNESHHWSLRGAHDVVAVVMAFVAAYNAKVRGVRHYVAQYMFNNPVGTSYVMDLGKMLAKIQLIESLHDETFTSYREVRAGLASLSVDMGVAKGQLASSTHLQMSLSPDIVHVVGFPEADHAARPEEVIESCKIARGVIRNCLGGLPDVSRDPRVIARRDELVKEAGVLLDAIRRLGEGTSDDPLADPGVIAGAIRAGLLDAPHLAGNPLAAGGVVTDIVNGACVALDPVTRKPIDEKTRLRNLGM